MLLSLCLFKHCSEYLKYPPSQMKCLFLSLQQRLRLFGALRSKMTVFFLFCFFQNGCRRCRRQVGDQNFSDFLRRRLRQKKPLPCFQSISLPAPPPLSAECQLSLGLKTFLFFLYCLILMSMLFQSCVSWLSLFVFDWSTQRVGFFFFPVF